ncbi:MAG: NifB/NifX family molybdenum-iron cluster-binding protein [Pseudomonadota bacterium]
MRIAIPIWEDRVSPVFDTALRLLVVEVEGRKESSRFIYYMEERDPTRKCFLVRNLDVDILICGAVSQPLLHNLLASSLDVIQQISGRAEEVLDAYLQGNILQSRFLMPGCKGYRHRKGREANRIVLPQKSH